MGSLRLRQLKEKVQLKGDEDEHEQVDSWSNRDLIPLPPSRRTWGWFHFFGYWTLNSLNVSNWQTPNTFLCKLCGVPRVKYLADTSGQHMDFLSVRV